MRKLISMVLVFIVLQSYGQGERAIIVTNIPQVVPDGKVWKLERGKPTIVQVKDGTLDSGTLCNAMFLSRPSLIFSVNQGDYSEASGFTIIFDSFNKQPYTNDYTYSINPVSFVSSDFDLNELTTKEPSDVGDSSLEFLAGETIFVSTCLSSIKFIQVDMSGKQLMESQRKQKFIDAELVRLTSNFKIPINPEKYVESGTEPDIYDENYSLIELSSSGVFHKRPGKGFAHDDQSIWTITLTIPTVTIRSNNGIEKSYKILDIEYDRQMNSQKFKLGDINGNHTHNLLASWTPSISQYSIILSSIDNSEKYQFQETRATTKR